MSVSDPTTPGCFSGIFWKRRPSRLTTSPKNAISISSQAKVASPSTKPVDGNNNEPRCSYINPACNFSYGKEKELWKGGDLPPGYASSRATPSWLSQDIYSTMEDTINSLDSDLRNLSLQIHGHPELGFEETYAHDLLTDFMSSHGFKVTRHYLGLSTAWRAEFTQGKGGRVLGINSEMDALRGIGHACGHNLIAMSGVGVAIAVRKALEEHNVPGTVVLLGTPAEEGGGGKAILLDRGAYEGMDACVMCHPSPGLPHSASLGSTNAMQAIEIEYFGRSAHAGAAPWEGTNALDAAFLAYSGISVLRQQIRPDHRIHGVVVGKDWSPNVIPDYAKMRWNVRAPTYAELDAFVRRVTACFEAAAHATSCTYKIQTEFPYYEVHQNPVLAQTFAEIIDRRFGLLITQTGTSASTDFGNVSYALPSIHPNYAIPTCPNGGNHTPEFAEAAASIQAHDATIIVIKALAATGYRLLQDGEFCSEVQGSFQSWKASLAQS